MLISICIKPFFSIYLPIVIKYIFIAIIAILLAGGTPSVAQVAYSKKAERTARRDERKQNKQYRKRYKRAEHRKDKKAVKKEMKTEDKEDKRRNAKMKDDITNPKVPIKKGD